MRTPAITDLQPAGHAAPVAAVLFLALFAAQASLIAVSPVLARVAGDLDVSVAAAGQLRTVAGLAAGATALAAVHLWRSTLRALLRAGAVLVAAGSAASAAAPDFVLLAAAQVAVGGGVALLLTGGTAAAAEWVAPEHRVGALSWALLGQPAAWIVGMPLAGVVGELDWRLAWLVLPLAASVVAAFAAATRPRSAPAERSIPRIREVLAAPSVARWALAELLANAGWTGTLVFSGALLVETFGTGPAATGLVLAAAAAAYVVGNRRGRRLVAADPRGSLVRLSLVLAAGIAAFGTVRPSIAVSGALLAAAAAVAGARTLVANAFALQSLDADRLATMGLRTAATQFGYVIGAAAGGAALAAGGYDALGAVLGLLLVASAATLAAPARRVTLSRPPSGPRATATRPARP